VKWWTSSRPLVKGPNRIPLKRVLLWKQQRRGHARPCIQILVRSLCYSLDMAFSRIHVIQECARNEGRGSFGGVGFRARQPVSSPWATPTGFGLTPTVDSDAGVMLPSRTFLGRFSWIGIYLHLGGIVRGLKGALYTTSHVPNTKTSWLAEPRKYIVIHDGVEEVCHCWNYIRKVHFEVSCCLSNDSSAVMASPDANL
jgi:hypothetical protein